MAADESIEDVVALERALLTPEVRRSRTRLEELLDPGFTEIGASGRLWSRAAMITALVEEDDGVLRPVPVVEMSGRLVAPDLVLLIYVSDPDGRAARRSSLWRYAAGRWRLRHHQGTLLPGAGISPAG